MHPPGQYTRPFVITDAINNLESAISITFRFNTKDVHHFQQASVIIHAENVTRGTFRRFQQFNVSNISSIIHVSILWRGRGRLEQAIGG